jgi:hypothetical protein
MKDGRTHLAHKAEHAADMESGAVVAVTLQAANAGDTHTIEETLAQAAEHITVVAEAVQQASGANRTPPRDRRNWSPTRAITAGRWCGR